MSYVKGEWNVWCDVCGFEFYASELKKRWDGAMVCSKDWEPRHPQELIKHKPETTIPWTRPEPAEIDGSPTYVASTVGTQSNTVPDGTFNEDTL